MSTRRLAINNGGGKTTILHKDADGIVTVERKQDVDMILRANAFQRNNQSMHHEEEVFNHYARIPTVSIHKWCKMKGITWREFWQDDKFMREFMNDSDNKPWRTRLGKV